MDSLNERLSPLPTNNEVLDHGFDFQPSWWQKNRPPEWGSVLDDLPVSPRGNSYRHATRENLFTLGRGVRPDDPVRTLVACYAWGVGDQGFRVGRYVRTFTKTAPDVLRSKLSAAQSMLLDDGPVEALRSLSHGGRNQLAYLGPSFFTKFLYTVNHPTTAAPDAR